jgi:hypothetical protein
MRSVTPEIVALFAIALLAGCDRPSQAIRAPRAPAQTDARAPGGQVDVGLAMLAATENARVAIGLGDAVAAANDLHRARAYAMQLPDRVSVLFPAQGAPASPSASALSAFDVQANLLKAATLLEDRDLQTAATALSAVERGIPARLVPESLPLLRARQDLELARTAVVEGHRTELMTHLLGAQRALDVFAGAPRERARALAGTFGSVARSPTDLGQLRPDKISVCWGLVDGWPASPQH